MAARVTSRGGIRDPHLSTGGEPPPPVGGGNPGSIVGIGAVPPPVPPPVDGNGGVININSGGQARDPNDPYYLPGGPGYVPPTEKNNDTSTLSTDLIGDIPPPPIPAKPVISQTAVPGTLARPGEIGARAFRTNAYTQQHPRFGPGVATTGGDTGIGGLTPDQIAEILRSRAAGNAGQQ